VAFAQATRHVLVSFSWHKGSSAPSLGSPAVENEGRDHAKGWGHSQVSISALTLLVGSCTTGRVSGPLQILCHLPQMFSSGKSEGKNEGNWLTQIYPENNR